MDATAQASRIETRIATLLQRWCPPAHELGIDADAVDAVMRQALQSNEGGKRLRAMLALNAYEAAAARPHTDGTSGDTTDTAAAIFDVACAIEVLQTAALVHDDIIDDSDLRRGKPAAHRSLSATFHRADIGQGLGIMLGDMLATASIAIAHDAASRLPNAHALTNAFLTMHRDVELGQVLDLAIELNDMDDPRTLAEASLHVFRWKTASYTTIAPLELGLLAAGIDDEKSHRWALDIGTPLGLAFQLADDLLDVVGHSARTGKPIGGDIKEGKRTVLLADALAYGTEAHRQELIAMFQADHRSEQDVARAITIFTDSGAIERSRQRIGELATQAHRALHDMSIQLQWSDAQHDVLCRACERFIPEFPHHQRPNTLDAM